MRLLVILTIVSCGVAAACAGPGPPTPERARPAPIEPAGSAAPAVEPVAVVSGRLPAAIAGSPEMRVEVLDLERVGRGTVRLRFALVNSSPDARLEIGDAFAALPADRGSVADVSLEDQAGGKRYYVIRDDRGRPQCSTEQDDLDPGERRILWASFPAPAAPRVIVRIPHVPAIPDVDITGDPADAR